MRKIIPQLTDIGLSALDLILQLENENTPNNDEILKKLSSSNFNKKKNFPNAHHTPRGYELDEIEWSEEKTKDQIDSELIPFERSEKKFRKAIDPSEIQDGEKNISGNQ